MKGKEIFLNAQVSCRTLLWLLAKKCNSEVVSKKGLVQREKLPAKLVRRDPEDLVSLFF